MDITETKNNYILFILVKIHFFYHIIPDLFTFSAEKKVYNKLKLKICPAYLSFMFMSYTK